MSLTPDQKIALWNTIGVWFAGVMTFFASATALWIAYQSRRTKLRASCTLQAMSGSRARFISISVINEGDRPVEILGCAWVLGKGKWKDRHLAVFDPYGSNTDFMPLLMMPAKTANFRITIPDNPNYFAAFARGYFKGRDLQTLRAVVYPSVGKLITVRPSMDVIEFFAKEVEQLSD